MLFDTRLNALDTDGRCSFAALMELYENNYIYIRRLVSDIDRSEDRVVSRVAGTPDLHLRVMDRCAYTTTVVLTHSFERCREPEETPDLRVRIYHDARVAEVLVDSHLRGFSCWRLSGPPRTGTLAWRWAVNRFLNRWLRYCLGEGHAFPTARQSAPAMRPPARRWAE